MSKVIFCKCGCGQLTTLPKGWIRNHWNKERRMGVLKERIYDLYWTKGIKSTRKVAKILKCSDSTILRRMKEFGILLVAAHLSGKEHQSYKHGLWCKDRKNYCIDCLKKGIKTEISSTSKRCRKEHSHKGCLGSNFVDGSSVTPKFCPDCLKKGILKQIRYTAKRCIECNGLHIIETEKYNGEKNPNFGNGDKIAGRNNVRFGKPAAHIKGDYYKRTWMRSSYEIAFAQFLTLSCIKWLYEPKAFDLGYTTYRPDFYIPEWNCYIEIKGWWRDKAIEKFNLFKKLYPKIETKILMKPDLQKLGVL